MYWIMPELPLNDCSQLVWVDEEIEDLAGFWHDGGEEVVVKVEALRRLAAGVKN